MYVTIFTSYFVFLQSMTTPGNKSATSNFFSCRFHLKAKTLSIRSDSLTLILCYIFLPFIILGRTCSSQPSQILWKKVSALLIQKPLYFVTFSGLQSLTLQLGRPVKVNFWDPKNPAWNTNVVRSLALRQCKESDESRPLTKHARPCVQITQSINIAVPNGVG